MKRHWTERKPEAFQHYVAFDFLGQIEQRLENNEMTRTDLANKLGISKSRVSQIFNNPGNLTLRNMIEWSRAVQLKLGILAYNDDDPFNEKGPINSGIFIQCWDRVGNPRAPEEI